ncbi:hypothetical protein RRF57_009380 [Xylaria bambusicola]|uniref:Uncharacterized protein n=1 Tax=Xylaria bambusicola TaxID=326684 RepID=A0AAN7ZBX9_9PEZI
MAALMETTMNYHLDPSRGGSKPSTFGTIGVLRRKFDSRPIQIHDLRGLESEFDIHTHSFQIHDWKPGTTSLDSNDVKQIIYPETEELIKSM